MKKKESMKLRMEEYLDFLHSNKQRDLTSNLLNQIIFMHGFKKIHRLPKWVLSEAVSAIELIDPARSTLEEEFISPCAAMGLEEIVSDLKDLDWQECCVTSVQTIRCSNNAAVPNCGSSVVGASSGATRSGSSFSIRRKRKGKGKAGESHAVGEWGSKKKRGSSIGANSDDTGDFGDGGSADKCDFSSGPAALGLLSLGYSS